MPRYGQLVMGPAGSGKSRYCSTIQKQGEELGRSIHVINLDPAAEHFDYTVLADIRDLISVSDVMEEETLRFGPNGGLVFCMEYLAQNFDWLEEQLEEVEDDYILFDCPGQIELYTHIPVMKQLLAKLHSWGFQICGIFLLESQFMIEPSKFVSGMMSALSAMVNLEVPHINVMTKLDLLNKKAKKDLEKYLEPDMHALLGDETGATRFGQKFQKLNQAIASVVDDYSMVKFYPLDITDDDSVRDILTQADLSIQYGEDLEPREPKDTQEDEKDNEYEAEIPDSMG